MTYTEFITRLGIALALGALIGIERQYRQKSAGLRTNTLVSLGAASFILLSESLTDNWGDPSRIAGQIVTGIGFLGAGVIMKSGFNIQGLNTAATIWCSAAVGSLTGAGLIVEAAIIAVAVSLIHVALRPAGLFHNRFNFSNNDNNNTPLFRVTVVCKERVENHLRVQILNEVRKHNTLQLRSVRSSDDDSRNLSIIDAFVLANGKQEPLIENLVSNLTMELGVSEVSREVESYL